MFTGWTAVGRVGGLFCHMKEVSNMTIKELYKFIDYNDNVSIVDKVDVLNSWSGEGKKYTIKIL